MLITLLVYIIIFFLFQVRLFIIALICGPSMSEAEIDQYCVALQASNCDLTPVQYVRRWKSYSKMTMSNSNLYAGGGVTSTSMFTNLLSKVGLHV